MQSEEPFVFVLYFTIVIILLLFFNYCYYSFASLNTTQLEILEKEHAR